MKTLLTFFFSLFTFTAFCQETKSLKVNISVINEGKQRKLSASVEGGSGNYYYSWGSSAMYGINTDKLLRQVVIPLDEEDISYEVYARDRETGVIGWKSVNFSKKRPLVKLTTYPNPTQDYVMLKLNQASEGVLDNVQHVVKAELFSEKDSKLVKSIQMKDLTSDEVSIDVKGLAKGVYYVHLTLNDDVHTEPSKQIVRVLVSGNESR